MRHYARICEAIRYEPKHFELVQLTEAAWGRSEVGVGSAAPHSTGQTLTAAAPSVGMEPAEERPSLGTYQVCGGTHVECSICQNHRVKLDPDYQGAVKSNWY